MRSGKPRPPTRIRRGTAGRTLFRCAVFLCVLTYLGCVSSPEVDSHKIEPHAPGDEPASDHWIVGTWVMEDADEPAVLRFRPGASDVAELVAESSQGYKTNLRLHEDRIEVLNEREEAELMLRFQRDDGDLLLSAPGGPQEGGTVRFTRAPAGAAAAIPSDLEYGGVFVTTRPVIWSWPNHEKRMERVLEGFHGLHTDIDRAIFDMEEVPLEDVAEKEER